METSKLQAETDVIWDCGPVCFYLVCSGCLVCFFRYDVQRDLKIRELMKNIAALLKENNSLSHRQFSHDLISGILARLCLLRRWLKCSNNKHKLYPNYSALMLLKSFEGRDSIERKFEYLIRTRKPTKILKCNIWNYQRSHAMCIGR